MSVLVAPSTPSPSLPAFYGRAVLLSASQRDRQKPQQSLPISIPGKSHKTMTTATTAKIPHHQRRYVPVSPFDPFTTYQVRRADDSPSVSPTATRFSATVKERGATVESRARRLRSRSLHLRPKTSEGRVSSPTMSAFLRRMPALDSSEHHQHQHQQQRRPVDDEAVSYSEMKVTDSPISKNHFRPIRYEVAAELDAIFGMTKAQKRQRALRTRDEHDGTLWFDSFEKEECQYLLDSALNSPSRRSNSAPGSPVSPSDEQERRGSSFAIAGNQLLSLENDGNTMMTALTAAGQTEGADMAAYTFVPMAPLPQHVQLHPRQPNTIRTRKTRSYSAVQRSNHVGNYLCVTEQQPRGGHEDEGEGKKNDNEEPLKLSMSTIQMPAFLPLPRHQASAALLIEAFDRPLKQASDGTVEDTTASNNEAAASASASSTLRARLTSQGRATPSTLDLSRSRPTETAIQVTHLRSGSNAHDAAAGRGGRRRPSTMSGLPSSATQVQKAIEQGHQHIVFRNPFGKDESSGNAEEEEQGVGLGISSAERSAWSPWSPPLLDSAGNPPTIRRGSSLDYTVSKPFHYFDESYVPHFQEKGDAEDEAAIAVMGARRPRDHHHHQRYYSHHHSQRGRRGEASSSPTKAAAMLGMNPLNANLLAPGGLPTGEQVYHGVDIPCASVHLASDDEDEGDGPSNSGKKGMKGWLSKKIRNVS
ncbi:hypothetical protein FA10DRAFT_269153 [Acaromyces ingoldii]|uniref:Uncharacterized protein n=1 Tax=Acaromyces ingoldii TaxID=215250 RepID=A0A316YEM2_9BASI|nr:hypothetical protein FA10DRAFT_269153 [Acaromyces ingoldii]PWN87867.1 hypothetical protein FA10DRAFT_269153 [Acaromyces ingoldii]